jgi:hypothetical protein
MAVSTVAMQEIPEAQGDQATPDPRSRRIGTNRNLGANPTSASTSRHIHPAIAFPVPRVKR